MSVATQPPPSSSTGTKHRTIPQTLWDVATSLRVTVVLLSFALVLIFLGTLDQQRFGIHHTLDLYFKSWVVASPVVALFLSLVTQQFNESLAWMVIPLPAGYTLGVLTLINLSCAHFRYFKPSWKKGGIALIHGGILLLIVSGFVSGMTQREAQMVIEEGKSTQHLINNRLNELVVIETTDPEADRVVSFPEEMVRPGATLTHPDLPFDLTVHRVLDNAAIAGRGAFPNAPPNAAGFYAFREDGTPILAVDSLPPAEGVLARQNLIAIEQRDVFQEDRRNIFSAFVTMEEGGTWLVSNVIDDRFPAQTFTREGRTYEIALRFAREYLPFALHLEDFRFDRHPGTQIPSNFSSLVRIEDPAIGDEREALIYMNHPLRYGGLTFYQASFDQETETSTVLQVVSHPGWMLPYIAITLVGLGLCFQFGYHLVRAMAQRRTAS